MIVEAWGDDAAHPIWTIQEGASTVKTSITQWRGVDRAILVEVPFGSNLNVGLINVEVFGAQKIPDLSPYFLNIKDPTMRELSQECVGKLYAWYDGEIPDTFKFGRKPQDPNSFEGILQAYTVHITTVDRSLGSRPIDLGRSACFRLRKET